MTPEGKIKLAILRYLRNLDNMWFWCVQDRFTSGIMDIVGCYCGYFIGIEVKVYVKDQTALQRHTMNKALSAGACCIVAVCVEDVIQFIGSIDNEHAKNTRQRARRNKKVSQ